MTSAAVSPCLAIIVQNDGATCTPPSTAIVTPVIQRARGEGQKEAGVGDVFRRAQPRQRNAFQPATHAIRPVRLQAGTADQSRRHRVDPDSVPGQFQGGTARELLDTRLGRAVMAVREGGRRGFDRGDVDDRPAAPGLFSLLSKFEHRPRRPLRTEMRPCQIGRQDVLPLADFHFQERRKRIDAGVVDQHVQPTPLRDSPMNQPVDIAGKTQIGLHRQRIAAFRPHLVRHFQGIAFGLRVADHNGSASLSKAPRDSCSDSPAAAGDKHGPACEV